MTAPKITFDTNILIYSVARGSDQRHSKAVAIIEQAAQQDCVLTLQSLAEFYNATLRKGVLDNDGALEYINYWKDFFPIVNAQASTLIEAIHLKATHKISFWDAMLIATAQEAGVKYLLSEDLNHAQQIGRIKIINPFITDSWKE